jgi:hypothetical protein
MLSSPAGTTSGPSLTFVNLRPDGVLPYWHRPDDVFENVDADVLGRTQAFVWELLQRIDSRH